MAASTSACFRPPPPLSASATLRPAELSSSSAISFPFNLSADVRGLGLRLASSPSSSPLKVVCMRGSKGGKKEKTAKPDPVYRNRLVSMFVNRVLKNGKKSLAYFIMYRALRRVQEKTGQNPLAVLRDAVQGVTPDVAVKSRRVGGATQQVPVEVDTTQGKALAIRWLLVAARKRQGRDMVFKLSNELIDAAKGSAATVVTKDSWEKSILKSDTPVLVEFHASWCGPCKMVHRVIDELAGEYQGRIQCFVLNADNDSDIAEDYDIKAVPVVLLFKNGEKQETVVGTMPKEFYAAAIERVLKP
ncbi:unnamed protein product [Linum tenue]|uniref:Ribosomal protein S7 n=1 Tax=Linum tenue TaxID=586396 RepID=A0AAV0RIX8_9ROSI|nr:unnamed protein product [Linum tenue]